MRVLGIDPGITRCGLGVVDVDPSRRASMVFVGVARSSTELAQHFRLAKIADAIDHVISLYEPEVVAIEQVFAQDNLRPVSHLQLRDALDFLWQYILLQKLRVQ